jgi:excisionase family DNA binding protein
MSAYLGSLSNRTRPEDPAMLTRDQVASYLCVSTRTLDRLIQAGEIPAYRIGGHRRFRREDLDSFIDSRREEQ